MRRVGSPDQITPFGFWIREFGLPANQCSVTNLDYVIEDYRAKRIMLLEEKQQGGTLKYAQKETFRIVDDAMRRSARVQGYTYWGLYIIRFPQGITMPGPGMTLNERPISGEELQAHIRFERRFCEPYFSVEAA